MTLIRTPRPWELDEHDTTPEATYWSRRELIAGLGGAAIAGGAALTGCGPKQTTAPVAAGEAIQTPEGYTLPAFSADPGHSVAVPPTPETIASRYNNFYEFTTAKDQVWRKVDRFHTRPWAIEIAGLVERPIVLDMETLLNSSALVERVYRFRCVEAWSMVVPWIGVPMRDVLERARPLSSARYVSFTSFLRPSEAEGQRTQTWYPWPYYEGLRMDEAMNELAMFVVGVYGKILPTQHGAPFRAILPWKYGFKSAKSIVRIDLTEEQPATFWNDLAPLEYDFLANVNPSIPHPRWSQASERDIATGDRKPTQIYNGYADAVGKLYLG